MVFHSPAHNRSRGAGVAFALSFVPIISMLFYLTPRPFSFFTHLFFVCVRGAFSPQH